MKQDLFKTDMSQASVITMYLLPDTVNLLKDKFLAELKPGTRIVSHDYPLTGWIPEKYVQMDLEEKVADQRRHHHAHLPLRRAGQGGRQLDARRCRRR